MRRLKLRNTFHAFSVATLEVLNVLLQVAIAVKTIWKR